VCRLKRKIIREIIFYSSKTQLLIQIYIYIYIYIRQKGYIYDNFGGGREDIASIKSLRIRIRLNLRFKKVRFKITILKCEIWKKWFLKTQLSVWQNRSLAFKISNLPLKFCVFKKTSSYMRFEKAYFLHFQIAIFKYAVPKRFILCDLV